MSNQKVGYVALLGRPNAGKSTLLNTLVGQKIAGVSAKPQTTRNKIMGICNHNQTQMLFLDTPGMHRSKGATINSLMNKEAFSVIEESDAILYLIDVRKRLEALDKDFIRSIISKASSPVIFCLSQVDRVKKKELSSYCVELEEQLSQVLHEIEGRPDMDRKPSVLTVSAKDRSTLPALWQALEGVLPEGDWMFPEDELTDRSQKFIAGELIREKVFRLLGEEIPYQTAVRVDEFSFEPRQVAIIATVIVARNSHKGMVVGKRGAKIKEIGIQSRLELEKLLGQKVFLDLQVKVDAGWMNNRQLISEYSSLDLG